MIKVITTVGTSLFTNYMKKEVVKSLKTLGKRDYELDDDAFNRALKDKATTSDLEDELKSKLTTFWIHNLKKEKDEKVNIKYVQGTGLNVGCCAEVQTLIAIANKAEYKDQILEVHLLCTDTQLSQLAASIIKDLTIPNITFVEPVKIDKLQVKNAKDFEDEGFFNLVKEVQSIKGDDENVVLNISGGYKALIPPLTLLAQLEKLMMYYIYEDEGKLIETGALPINFDWSVIEKYVVYLNNNNQRNNRASEDTISDMQKLYLIKQNSRDLTLIGDLLRIYSQKASPFTETIFGYFIEHKVFECYAKEYGRDKVQHSVKFGEMNGSDDIDIFIQPKEGEFITVESKHAEFVLPNSLEMEKIIKNLIFRANQAHNDGQGNPSEIWLMLYSYSSINDKNNQFNLLVEYKEELDNIINAIQQDDICKKAIFKAKHFFIVENKLKDKRHVYQDFMRDSLKIKNIIDIYDSSKL